MIVHGEQPWAGGQTGRYGVQAATASANYMQVFPRLPNGVRTITLREADAGAFWVGAYVDFEGRIWKVAARQASEDWSTDEIYVCLHGVHYVEEGLFTDLLAGATTERVRWLEDS